MNDSLLFSPLSYHPPGVSCAACLRHAESQSQSRSQREKKKDKKSVLFLHTTTRDCSIVPDAAAGSAASASSSIIHLISSHLACAPPRFLDISVRQRPTPRDIGDFFSSPAGSPLSSFVLLGTSL
ncbi:uncharacterized protein K489DRAFT_22440 [Dissoconium aciculare CBS 342.82]|uniref:Uncharacterized protein n=1 Tax=Dissoconium aciculare CBS 342.82 TaxID=1314786 RepID=A0A6J3MI98_9PEZI|nr:uncharacterized protein K489DRAFT_22440 [Dissoconium aciculare CBS 342.82]KAF1827628.1 hypothetical protein K489DRAFT_22440 [Dissoconium aciculare CBS 342.82]